ncbi:tRNA (guanosine(37)-N1)-methyltransferase TrmD [Jiulongibacter sediminis]|uniref:tRNA (guanine-N(1)-)-methyltransferase n=1 Tax=Jiulongibacter sediminis TaxID=1605367 RepID=A0A0P7BQT3_9BACT|nr:tRNA (guanosine(37)-N1)-methyltransferase TrmD [Jiulongibacter sediminis]KPM49577.1 tRNA (guanine-N1)-methyltransferase [Jiulongibacter sediminis]TBX26616.1 tRNA (guanine-N1)-methyltransferase [Jiulongibacter sediminis]
MQIDIVTCLPGLVEGFFSQSIVKRATEGGKVSINIIDLREYGIGKSRQIDDYAFGGGAGMVMMIEPLVNCIKDLQSRTRYDEIIYMTPDGDLFDQKTANSFSLKGNLMIICGHYKGIDERVRESYITKELSIGDYVLSGGEIPAAVVTDAIVRLIPGAMNDETSALTDSFQDNLLAPPVYTRPADFEGLKVPEILLSGNFKKIEEWRVEKAIERTQKRRPDLWKKTL